MQKKRQIICDVDDIVFNTSIEWLTRCINAGFVEKGLTDLDVLNRPVYYIDKWLNMSEENKNKFHAIFKDSQHEFYDNLQLTPFAEKLYLFHTKMHVDIHFVSKVMTDDNSSKTERLRTFFPSSNIIYVPLNGNKGEYIKRHMNINDVGLIVDDHLPNIIDILALMEMDKRDKLIHLEVLAPALGFVENDVLNQNLIKAYLDACPLKNTSFSIYNPHK